MIKYFKEHPWKIIEEGFDPDYNEVAESIFSLGNGRFGQRANFEEKYSGKSLQGNYIAGVYYPDKTRVGWWKNGYPEYFAKVLNAANWVGINVNIDGEELDLASCEVTEFYRELDMQKGVLFRSFKATLASGKTVRIKAKRFCSIADDEIGAVSYEVTPTNFNGSVRLTPYIDFDVINSDSNYDEKFWEEVSHDVKPNQGYIIAKTKKLDFKVLAAMNLELTVDGVCQEIQGTANARDKYIETTFTTELESGQTFCLHKYACILSTENYPEADLHIARETAMERARSKGFEGLLGEHATAWAKKWEKSDITIEGDVAAQQGIRFSIFQLDQTYTGEDVRLNIGPKGFTGEKYGGSTYWDTEAYCLPFYLATADSNVAKNLLIYRHRHLAKAIENAKKLGFSNGAALYPMVTINGEECHNEWEITFEEIHRNGAIAYAIYDYVNYTGDTSHIPEYGIDVLVGIAKFWSQRVSFSEEKAKYVMLGVTGPNEYENNINNNWYTNTFATWCLKYTLKCLNFLEENHPEKRATLNLDSNEIERWKDIIENMFYPYDTKREIFLQQDGFLDKDLTPVRDLDPKHLPLNQNWSWDRILRSAYIKQADVLQGICTFEENYDKGTIKRNFDFYEELTVHESSLSPCVHSILAASIGYKEKSYEMYQRASRLDLDNYNNDTEDGCHITSMAGSWLSIVKGFAGMRVIDGELSFDPFIPEEWSSYSFKINFRGASLQITVDKNGVSVTNSSKLDVSFKLKGEYVKCLAGVTTASQFASFS